MTDRSAVHPLAAVLDRLSALSIKDYYNPYQEFDWPDSLSDDQHWISPELMSVHGTPFAGQLGDEALLRLGRWESINFYSLNVHGIRELLLSVIRCLHRPGFEATSEYFHHFIGEENEHMWFFSTFCLRYGRKIYESKSLKYSGFDEPDIEHFVTFAQILIFEMIGDYYNVRMQDDERLPAIVRQINRFHHHDESRHIAMGREIVKVLHQGLCRNYPEMRLREVARYLRGYLKASIESLYNPSMYRDAGLAEPYDLRRALLAEPARHAHDRALRERIERFFRACQIFEREDRGCDQSPSPGSGAP